MLFKTHLAFGMFLYLILFFNSSFSFIYFLGIFLGVLLVDIDIKNSKIGKFFLFRPLQLFFKHRGVFHSIFCGFILMLVFSIINLRFSFAFFIGYLSHLFLDLFNIKGIMLFWPFSKKRFGFKIKTGGIIEDILFVLFFLVDIFLFLFIFVGRFNILF
ncbi:MAG: metal-dependent hydrolase [Candidatus Nanoarchaeia archaeon]|jgi:inner membrane protein|nr:metal-dependent hydrolase [Candidatus Nanoarchaeia archaeon]MDD3993645.1 metal-dependent hydrolase [Candidatus Nanoarchaeia archaeon]